MDALTGRRKYNKRHQSEEQGYPETKKKKPGFAPGLPQSKEYIPDIYKSVVSKKCPIEQPESEEERAILRALPCDTEAALLHLKGLFPKNVFGNRLPPIAMYSQLKAIVPNQLTVDTQLRKLAKENKIITFSTFTSSNYLVVFLEDFLNLPREGIFHRFVHKTLTSLDEADEDISDSRVKCNSNEPSSSISSYNVAKRSVENSRYFSKENLLKRWKYEENEIRQLVNAGYLGIHDAGLYCLSLPGAGEFIKTYQKGKKAVIAAIRKAKFGEVLQIVRLQ